MRKTTRAVLLTALLFAVLFSACVPAFASINGGGTDVGGLFGNAQGTYATYNQYLIVTLGTSVPAITFNYEVEPLTGTNGYVVEPDTNFYGVYGTDPNDTDDRKRLGSDDLPVAYSTYLYSDSTKYYSLQTGDTLHLSDGLFYVKDEIFIDFSDVTFRQAGVYRYKITATPEEPDGLTAMESYDYSRYSYLFPDTVLVASGDVRYIDVYVEQDESSDYRDLNVVGYIFHRTEDYVPPSFGGWRPWEESFASNFDNLICKDNGFVYQYAYAFYLIAKTITGNMADYEDVFPVTFSSDEAFPNQEFLVTFDVPLSELGVAEADGTQAASNPANTAGMTQATGTLVEMLQEELVPGTYYTFQADENGHVSKTFYLSNNDGAFLIGLPYGATFTVSENPGDYTAEWTDPFLDDSGTGNTRTLVVTEDIGMTMFTNTLSYTVSTGVWVTILPFLIIGICALTGVVFIYAHRKHKFERSSSL